MNPNEVASASTTSALETLASNRPRTSTSGHKGVVPGSGSNTSSTRAMASAEAWVVTAIALLASMAAETLSTRSLSVLMLTSIQATGAAGEFRPRVL